MKTICLITLTTLITISRIDAQTSPESWHEKVKIEIQQTLDDYRKAMLNQDFDSMLSFWSDSDKFVFAGDGRALGGSDAWKREMTRHYKNTQKWEQWDWQSVNILPLCESAASATLEFRFRWVDLKGETQNSRGAWTYIFQKSENGWKVIQTNGTHISL